MENQVGIHMNNTANDFTVMFCARSYFIKCIHYSYRIHLSNTFFRYHWQRFTSQSVQSERKCSVWKSWQNERIGTRSHSQITNHWRPQLVIIIPENKASWHNLVCGSKGMFLKPWYPFSLTALCFFLCLVCDNCYLFPVVCTIQFTAMSQHDYNHRLEGGSP
jgi:hypothetical protein